MHKNIRQVLQKMPRVRRNSLLLLFNDGKFGVRSGVQRFPYSKDDLHLSGGIFQPSTSGKCTETTVHSVPILWFPMIDGSYDSYDFQAACSLTNGSRNVSYEMNESKFNRVTEFYSDVFCWGDRKNGWNEKDLRKWWWQFRTIKWLVKSSCTWNSLVCLIHHPQKQEDRWTYSGEKEDHTFVSKWTMNRKKRMMLWKKLGFCVKLWEKHGCPCQLFGVLTLWFMSVWHPLRWSTLKTDWTFPNDDAD